MIDLLIGALIVGVLAWCAYEVRRVRRQRREAARLHAARLAAMKLVVDFEHTPVRGASRDRTLSGKARRQARRS